MRDRADMLESASSVTRYLAIAALTVAWGLAAVGATFALAAALDLDLMGRVGWGLAAMIFVVTALNVAGLRAGDERTAENTVGVGLLLAGGVWMLMFGIAALHRGLWPQAYVFADPFVLDLSMDWGEFAVYGALAALGLIPLSVGVSFIFGVGPLARPASKPEPKPKPSRQAAKAVTVEVVLVVAILALAAVVVRTVLHEGASFTSSVSSAPGP
jgi:hypothetical protein